MTKPSQERPDDATISEWKLKHKEVSQLSVVDKKDEKFIAIVRKPKMKDIDHALAMRTKKGDIAMARTLYTDCVLYEDPEIRQDEDIFMSIVMQMTDLITLYDTELKKL